jgi:hypothetical protein
MTVSYEVSHRQWPATNPSLCLEDKFEVMKEVGDGSFGSVALARVRSAGAQIARRGTLVRDTRSGRVTVCTAYLHLVLDRHQDDEENLRLV